MADPRLILVLGDQLSLGLSALREGVKSRDIVVMAEVREEGTYVAHHAKKIALILSAMRHFAKELRADGWTVAYTALDDAENTHSIGGEVLRRAEEHGADEVIATVPGEWRLRQKLDHLPIKTTQLPDDRFIASEGEFANWAEGRKSLRMEYFYREMRRMTGILMDGKDPEGGKWNYDSENRKPASGDLFMPEPLRVTPDGVTEDVLALVAAEYPDTFGQLEPFWFGTRRADAEKAADHFFKEALPGFGDYQDAMLEGERFLYHSVLSIYLNIGLLDPLDLCQRAEAEYRAGRAPLNAVEGYIRQILGWREFIRGIYFLDGPDYTKHNKLRAQRKLPDFYWTGETDMACIRAAVTQTIEEAYAHHIQRLMVTGNFALIAGINPAEVHEWYLAVYADAFEWVEAPNTIGMVLHADGGMVGSKPYAASGAYIDRMSDHCAACHYNVKVKHGEGACPFNPLYWDFLLRNRERFEGNPRMAQMYRTWDRMKPENQRASQDSAAAILKDLSNGKRI
ncbi:deoxyribodipyrimidine photolyase-related protein [Rubricella aquisinus]|uniref:Deoxyribodipyrimidine photolyase-related protein n=1 Tax=Rubricella aquisinus TaxID=2028108 RepID=A0A840WRR9_9RHOB|nr:cryptochrome/photolyase family protein [Rubricella aquisinus]MBB5516733.1 deoxyribodipyrimidine photolyase-related protein [Rubricella aquisinus]